MNWKQLAKDYFTFTRKERIGAWILIIVTISVWILPKMVSHGNPSPIVADSDWLAATTTLEQRKAERSMAGSRVYDETSKHQNDSIYAGHKTAVIEHLFYFDPNTLAADEWRKLGVREKTIGTIENYLSRGGHFHKPEDLQKIYGLRAGDFARLYPFIKIEEKNKQPDHPSTNEKRPDFSPAKPKYEPVDVNTADTLAFVALPGIGNKLAARIINFRNSLGGFYSINQVGETYALPDSTFQNIRKYLRLTDSTVKKININVATREELKLHPYIRWTLANAIVAYRNQHGRFSSLGELRNISLITDDIFNKIVHYLLVE